jgi:hypothetical protein
MATVVDVVHERAVISINCSEGNATNLCSCCEKVKNDLQRLKTELKPLEEIVNILKEDQDLLVAKLENSECSKGKKVNSVTNINSAVIISNDLKRVLNSKRSTNFAIEQQQEYKITTVINRYAILESLHEDNQVFHYHNRCQFLNEIKTKARIEQRTKVNK